MANINTTYDNRIKTLRSDLDRSKTNNINKYYILKLQTQSTVSQFNNLYKINKFFRIIGKDNSFNEDDLIKFLGNEWFLKLKKSSKNQYITHIKKYLIFCNYIELSKKLPYFKTKNRELSKNELIYRDDLKKILEVCKSKPQCLLMMLYESAMRKEEIRNVRKRDIQFEGRIVNLYIPKSKTNERNLPLIETTSFLREYFLEYDLEPDELLFKMAEPNLNKMLERVEKRIKKKYPDWNKHLFPHLFRHSRLYELAREKMLNLPQLNIFAGWEIDSNMGKIYFHLDDSDIRKILTEGEYEKPKIEKFKTKFCPICNAENNEIRSYCWKCKNIFDKSKLITERMDEQDKLKQMNEKIDKLEKAYETILESIKNKE